MSDSVHIILNNDTDESKNGIPVSEDNPIPVEIIL
jgi:hypothetical protein